MNSWPGRCQNRHTAGPHNEEDAAYDKITYAINAACAAARRATGTRGAEQET